MEDLDEEAPGLAGPLSLPPVANDERRPPSKDKAAPKEDEMDPIMQMRLKQLSEYEKLCLELRLRHNSAVRKALTWEEQEEVEVVETKLKEEVSGRTPTPTRQITKEKVCQCGNTFVADADFCRKCGRRRGLERSNTLVVERPPTTCSCGHVFMTDAIFCRKCGSRRPELNRDEDETGSGDGRQETRSVHEYNFSRLYLGDRQVQPLASALALDRQMVALFLPGIGMKDLGMISLCEQLKRSPALECIDVSQNRFSIGGAEACLRLVTGAQRLVLLKSDDTCLEEEFCNTRGLPAKYAAVRKDIQEVLMDRALSL